MMTSQTFNWADLGDIALGRPTLGQNMHVAAYRAFHFALRRVLEQQLGWEGARRVLVEAGRVAGLAFAQAVLDLTLPPAELLATLEQQLRTLGVGLLSVDCADFANLIFIFTVAEDLDCSGTADVGQTSCDYDEGLLAGILEAYTGKQFLVNETECWSSGEHFCRFRVVAI